MRRLVHFRILEEAHDRLPDVRLRCLIGTVPRMSGFDMARLEIGAHAHRGRTHPERLEQILAQQCLVIAALGDRCDEAPAPINTWFTSGE